MRPLTITLALASVWFLWLGGAIRYIAWHDPQGLGDLCFILASYLAGSGLAVTFGVWLWRLAGRLARWVWP